MAKLLKILLHFIGIILEWVLILLIFSIFAIRSSSFQTYLAQRVTAYLANELDTKITIEKVDIIFFNRVALDGVFILDQEKDTLADLKSIFVTLNSFDNKNKRIDIKEINLKKGNIKLNREQKEGIYNFQFLIDYFDSGPSTTKSEPFEVKLNKISLSQINFKYDDFRQKYSPYGVDFDHLHLKNLYLNTQYFKILKDGGIETYIKHISFREKSGFEIDKFSSKVNFDDHGLRMKYLRIITPKSKIFFSKLNLKTKQIEDFDEFEDKVVFDADLKKSIVSLDDVSMFASDLQGMKQKIILQAKVTQRVKDLKIANLELSTGNKTKVQGTFNLPDFRDLDKSYFNEHISYAYIDLEDIENIILPISNKERTIKLDSEIKKFNHIIMKDFSFIGTPSKFVVKSDAIKTNLGTVEIDYGMMFTENKTKNSYTFQRSYPTNYDIKIDSFQLGKLISNKDIGPLNGQFSLKGEIFNSGKVNLQSIRGNLNHFRYLNYTYQNINIIEASFVNNVFDGEVDIKDDNLDMTYNGFLDLNHKQHFQFDVDISKAVLGNLHITNVDSTLLKSAFSVNISGTNLTDYSGTISLNHLFYTEGKKHFEIPAMYIEMDRSQTEDMLIITSEFINVYLKGKVNLSTIADDINNQFSTIFPAIFKEKNLKSVKQKNKFDYRVQFNEVDEFLSIFVPGLKISNCSFIDGYFDGYKKDFVININSNKISYNEITLTNLNVNQLINKTSLDAQYSADKFSLNDSISVDNIVLKATGEKDEINSELKWNPNTSNESFFSWKTTIKDLDNYLFNIDPSYFVIKNNRWNIVDNSQIIVASKNIQIQNFKIQRNQQFLTIDGTISDENENALKLQIHDLELADFSYLLGSSTSIKGKVNGIATIYDPFKNIHFSTNTTIQNLYVNNLEVGDINLNADWKEASESIDLSGELFYKKEKTFNFNGSYFLAREKNSLNFDLDFNNTNIQFANAFLDPQVVSDIRGLVDGKIKITGTPEKPEVQGSINLSAGSAKVEMFGVYFGFDGEIYADKEGVYIDNMPITDEDGNTGALIGTIFHHNFTNWNFDLEFNLMSDAYSIYKGVESRGLERFLVMNTKYKEGDIYYGKAYVQGTANISGYAENLNINVDLETQKGTEINFPMYGTSEIKEDNFISFQKKDSVVQIQQPKIDFTGVNLDLNFRVNPKAKLKIIFDENLGDEILAYGQGNIAINMNDIGDLKMNGVFEVTKGSVYNFVMPPIPKQPFYIEEGGTITWTGDPYNAQLDLQTYLVMQTSLAEISTNIEQGQSKQPKEVRCYLSLSKTLVEPKITFDIIVPKATESDNAALNRIKSNQDELNKQFFSLLLVKKFQPLEGNVSAGSGAALDIVSSQINDALSSLSDKFKMNVDIQENEQSFGLQKTLLNERLIIKGSLGIENNSSTQTQNSLIGDINLEYLINKDGTFRANIFNESNDNTATQNSGFTQGASINYQENFNNFRDFKMIQYFLDIFRKPNKKRLKKNQRQTNIPKDKLKTVTKP